MRTHQIHSCARPGCRAWTIRRHCEDHETASERELRTRLDGAVVALADAEEAYVAAVRADDPPEVVANGQAYASASIRLRMLEQRLGMIR
jgi:hypothetical protein